MKKTPKTLLSLALLSAMLAPAAQASSPNIIRSAASIPISNNDDQFWSQIDALASDWVNIGPEYACSDWAPDPSSQTVGSSFLQTQLCSQDQEQTIQHRQQNSITHVIRELGSPVISSRTIPSDHTREAVGTLESWISTSPVYTEWTSASGAYNCSGWSPRPSDYTSSASFTQTSTTCVVDQARQRQDREIETTTKDVRNVGSPVAESRQLTGQSASRPYVISIGDWADTGSKKSCSNWAPATTSIGLGKAFTQTATDCQQDQVRPRNEQYTDHLSGQKVTALNANETQTITVSDTREAVGSLEDWIAASSTYTEWAVTKGPYNCASWTPSGSSYTSSASFTQASSTCALDQTRNRQDREQESNTGTYRDKGSVVAENRTLTGQIASRPYQVALGTWTNSGAVTSCSNWSPAPSTVTVGSSFTQTATDCAQAQTRSRVETYTDNETGRTVTAVNTNESRSIAASSTRSATGTKETWVAATPAYGTWVNSGSLTSCSNWTPAGSGYTSTASFTQTATNCSQSQTRSVQPREQETTTGAYRNTGSVTSESRTLTSQTATRPYSVTLGSWTNSGGVTGCSNWSPATSTVASGTSFTQTATNCTQAQVRSRVERYNDHASGTLVTAVNTSESRSIAASSTRTATGTRVDYQYSSTTRGQCFIAQHAGMGGAPYQINGAQILWNGTSVWMKAGAGATCTALGLSTGAILTGTDGYKYTVGPRQVGTDGVPGAAYSVKRN